MKARIKEDDSTVPEPAFPRMPHERPHRMFFLNRLKPEFASDKDGRAVSGSSLRDVDLAGRAVRFHKRRRIDAVAPDVEAHPATADDAGNDRRGLDADA